ncbi:2-amino-4-hydroxy-6-hydroxymethyldihydropteridine diphosphokinase [bacterium]|nr:2-amino-4-hydroxy-6-hydroxymethyldihydropteridine diphosphokinase [bacterium]
MASFRANGHHRVIIAIGSNIHPEIYVPKALQIISKKHRLISQSQFVLTKPVGYPDQNDFLNGAVQIETRLSRKELNQWLKKVEKQLDRKPATNKNGPRTIDLDIVVWNGKIVDRDVYKRSFIKNAVSELDPGIFNP